MLRLYQPNWSWGDETDSWILKMFQGKSILNFPSGKSSIGFRVDLDPNVKPDFIADLDNHPFKKESYDVVVCDAPFSKYCKFKWLTQIAEIAKTDLLISTPYMCPHINNFELFETYLSRVNKNFYLRLWLHFKRKNMTLTFT